MPRNDKRPRPPNQQRQTIEVIHHFDQGASCLFQDLISALQGRISQEDQKLLDDIEAKAKRQSEKLAALDALTPPIEK